VKIEGSCHGAKPVWCSIPGSAVCQPGGNCPVLSLVRNRKEVRNRYISLSFLNDMTKTMPSSMDFQDFPGNPNRCAANSSMLAVWQGDAQRTE
jgi:hypothetical protein